MVERSARMVVVDIARAGTLPAQVCYDLLNRLLDPRLVRQDHVIMARKVDGAHRVIGTEILGNKVGGDVDDALLVFPDPMGATGSSIAQALEFYRTTVGGRPRRVLALHLIVTPEYLRRMRDHHPELTVYAVALLRPRAVAARRVRHRARHPLGSRARPGRPALHRARRGRLPGEIMNNVYV